MSISVDTCAQGQVLSPYTKNEDDESVISYSSNGSGTLRSALHIIEDMEEKQTILAAASEGFLDLQKKFRSLQASLRQRSLDLKVKNAELENCKVEVSLLTRTLHKAFASADKTIREVEVEQEHEDQDDYYEYENIREGKTKAKTKNKNKPAASSQQRSSSHNSRLRLSSSLKQNAALITCLDSIRTDLTNAIGAHREGKNMLQKQGEERIAKTIFVKVPDTPNYPPPTATATATATVTIAARSPTKQDSLQGLMLQPASSSLHAHINEVGKASAGAAAATTKTEKPSSFFSPQPVKKVVTSASASQNKQFRRFTEQQILEQSQSQSANPNVFKSLLLGSSKRARTAALHTTLSITNDDPRRSLHLNYYTHAHDNDNDAGNGNEKRSRHGHDSSSSTSMLQVISDTGTGTGTGSSTANQQSTTITQQQAYARNQNALRGLYYPFPVVRNPEAPR